MESASATQDNLTREIIGAAIEVHRAPGQRIDVIVRYEVVVEIKSLSKVPEIVLAQVLSYLKATGLKRGLIINFGEKRLVDGIRRVSN